MCFNQEQESGLEKNKWPLSLVANTLKLKLDIGFLKMIKAISYYT